MANPKIQKQYTYAEVRHKISPSLRQEFFSYFKYFLKVFCSVALVYFLIRGFVFDVGYVSGNSMLPGFRDSEVIFINQITNYVSEYYRGDAVVLRNDDEYFIKRIIALPGEQIAFEDGRVYIKRNQNSDWVELDESLYLSSQNQGQTSYRNSKTRQEEPVLAAGEYYVLGDNRIISKDSRAIGPVKREDVLGKIGMIISPEFKTVDLPRYNIPN